MPITSKEFEYRLLEFAQQYGFSNVENFLQKKKLIKELELLADPTINAYLRRDVDIIDGVPQLSEYEIMLYSNRELIPYRHFSKPTDISEFGLTYSSGASVFSGKFGETVQQEKDFASYKNIHFFGMIDGREIKLLPYFKEICGLSDENMEPQYYIGDVGYGNHFSVIVFTIQPKTITYTWIDSRDFNPKTPALLILEGKIKKYSNDEVKIETISLGIQNQGDDKNCAFYGLNVIKAVARLVLKNLPLTQEAIIDELSMYYYNGVPRDYEIIKAYHLKEKWKIGNLFLEDFLNGSIEKKLADSILNSDSTRLKEILLKGLKIDEITKMEEFIFGDKKCYGINIFSTDQEIIVIEEPSYEIGILSDEGSIAVLSPTGNNTFIDNDGKILELSVDGSMQLLGQEELS